MDNSVKIQKFDIPEKVSRVTSVLKNAGFEAYLVGGCVRDLFMGRKPKDWDVTTNAKPEEIIPLFPKTVYENNFGTVAVVDDSGESMEDVVREEGSLVTHVTNESESLNSNSNDKLRDNSLKVIEITPYRIEGAYSDHRRPDSVIFSDKIEDDLKRRDFTINSIAYDADTGEIIDPFYGVADLARGLIKTVGDPNDRFNEDGLRILRAIRFHVELGFVIDSETEKAILENKDILKSISKERIRDEFIKIIMSPNPSGGLELMRKLGVLTYVIPELEDTIGIEQNKAHSYDVWTHLIKTVQHSADKGFPLHVRLSALFHDISKPASRRFDQDAKQWTFYGHEVVGSRVTKRILENLKFSRETIERVSKLVRWHMFFSDTAQITHSAVRRMISNVGKENVWDLINIRHCDRIGTGRPKENPYRLRKYQSMIEEVMADPISVGMLKVNGQRIMELLDAKPGPIIGQILNALLEEILDDPKLNTKEYLENRVIELSKLPEGELKKMSEKGKEKREKEEEKIIKQIRNKHFVA